MPEPPRFLGNVPQADAQKKGGAPAKGKPPALPAAELAEISAQLNNISRRLKIIEERYTNMRKKMQLTDDAMLKFEKKLNSGIKGINDEVAEFKREFIDLRDKVKLIVKELKLCAKAEEIKVLEKYISLWEPVNFLTRKEAERIIEDKISEISQNQSN